METENKLEEAKYFFNQIKNSLNNPQILGFNLSAFITAARTVTWFMQKEYSANPKFKTWYEAKQKEMKEDSVCKFFHNLRTANIHTKSPETNREVSVSIAESVPVSDSISVKVIRAGKVIQESSSKETEINNSSSMNHNTNTKNSIPHNNVTIKIFFREKSEEDGISLCESYLSKVVKIVNELLQIKE